MSTDLERPGGTSSGLPSAVLGHAATAALPPVLGGAPTSAPPGRPISRRHSASLIEPSHLLRVPADAGHVLGDRAQRRGAVPAPVPLLRPGRPVPEQVETGDP